MNHEKKERSVILLISNTLASTNTDDVDAAVKTESCHAVEVNIFSLIFLDYFC
jgi:hypothetical protein